MTNHELLRTPDHLLGELGRQRRFLLRTEGTPLPCPACKEPVSYFQAAGIDPDAYDFGATRHDCRCPTCGAELEQVVPFIASGGASWYWQLKDSWLQEQLRKARLFDEQTRPGADAGPS